MDMTHVGLLASVRRLTAAPNATASGTADADLLAHANELLQGEIAPLVLELCEDYFVLPKSVATVAGQANYRLPYRAMGLKLKDVGMQDAAGNFRSLALIDQSEIGEYSTSGTPEAFYLRGGYIILVPAPADTSETLQLPHYIRPNQIVSTNYGTVTTSTIPTSAPLLLAFSVTGTFSPTTSSVLDLVSYRSGYDCLAIDQTPTAAVAATSVTFSALPVGVLTGDYICTAEQSPVPQIPQEFHPLLYVKTARRVAETLGNAQRIGYLQGREQYLEERIRAAFDPRVDGEPRVLGPGPFGLLGTTGDW